MTAVEHAAADVVHAQAQVLHSQAELLHVCACDLGTVKVKAALLTAASAVK